MVFTQTLTQDLRTQGILGSGLPAGTGTSDHQASPGTVPGPAELPGAIDRLRKRRNAIILAHYYQEDAIQDCADFVGDSLELSRRAAATDADVIVFCGVHFMAETAKILNPTRTVLLPDVEAGCSLADTCPADAFGAFRAAASGPHGGELHQLLRGGEGPERSDLHQQQRRPVGVPAAGRSTDPVRARPEPGPLGTARQSGRDLTLWPGSCIVHETFSEQALLRLRLEHPDAEVIAHPECQQHLLDLADFIGSTSKLLHRTETSPAPSFIVLTEPGILHQMRQRVPHKTFHEVPGADGCSCNACPYMRLNSLDKLWRCLDTMAPQLELEEELRLRALTPIERMLAMSA